MDRKDNILEKLYPFTFKEILEQSSIEIEDIVISLRLKKKKRKKIE